jgi:hypothetical protein
VALLPQNPAALQHSPAAQRNEQEQQQRQHIICRHLECSTWCLLPETRVLLPRINCKQPANTVYLQGVPVSQHALAVAPQAALMPTTRVHSAARMLFQALSILVI